jgi:hypothetical protein
MELKRLSKEEFVSKADSKGEAYIRFYRKGLIILNRSAAKHLKLYDKRGGYGCVSLCVDVKSACQADFTIEKSADGWQLRCGPSGGAVFNNVSLARHVLDKTWELMQSHPVGAVKPLSQVFKIATVAIDEKNSGVYALIRRKK